MRISHDPDPAGLGGQRVAEQHAELGPVVVGDDEVHRVVEVVTRRRARCVELDVEVDAETPARRVRAPRQTPASAKPTRPRKTAAPRKSPPRSSAVRVIRATDEDGQTADNGDPALSEGEIRQLAEEDARFNGES